MPSEAAAAATFIFYPSTNDQIVAIKVPNRAALLLLHLSALFSNSDDHLLKNIELFDRLSLSFNSRVLFIKDVIGDEICCWSFYGQGRKLAEVCCTSIVYATEKKQTKVRGGVEHSSHLASRCSDGARTQLSLSGLRVV